MATPSKTDKMIVILATPKHDCKNNYFWVELQALEKIHNFQLYLNMGVFKMIFLLSHARETSSGTVNMDTSSTTADDGVQSCS